MAKKKKVEHKRIKLSELDKNIYRPNDTTVLDPDNSIDPIIIAYTTKGNEDELDNNGLPVLHDELRQTQLGKDKIIPAELLESAYAKQTFNGKRHHYYVKTNQRGDLYDPKGLYEEWNSSKQRLGGEPMWKFREVNLRVFELYTSFLKTGNKAWLHNAGRAHK